jgi:hypothetical protein
MVSSLANRILIWVSNTASYLCEMNSRIKRNSFQRKWNRLRCGPFHESNYGLYILCCCKFSSYCTMVNRHYQPSSSPASDHDNLTRPDRCSCIVSSSIWSIWSSRLSAHIVLNLLPRRQWIRPSVISLRLCCQDELRLKRCAGVTSTVWIYLLWHDIWRNRYEWRAVQLKFRTFRLLATLMIGSFQDIIDLDVH